MGWPQGPPCGLGLCLWGGGGCGGDPSFRGEGPGATAGVCVPARRVSVWTCL